MKYDKEFEEIVNTAVIDSWWTMEDRLWFVWQAARKDHYRIGEEVEARAHSMEGFSRGVVTAHISGGFAVIQPINVRRIPAKSRIDEIAEEAEDKYRRGAVGAGSLTDIIKSAILQACKEWESNQ